MTDFAPALVHPRHHHWFHKRGEVKDGVVRICVRKYRHGPSSWIRVRYRDYVEVIASWLSFLDCYWARQFSEDPMYLELWERMVPMNDIIVAAASWVFQRELSDHSDSYVRSLIARLFGLFRLMRVTVHDVLPLLPF